MLRKTERVKNNSPEHHAKLFAEMKEPLSEVIEKVGVTHVKSCHITPEVKPKLAVEEPPTMKL